MQKTRIRNFPLTQIPRENEPYSIVYGGLMFVNGTFDDIKDAVESLKGKAP